MAARTRIRARQNKPGTDEFEAKLLAALDRPEGTLIEVILDPDVISTRGTLSSITQNALSKLL